jgi:hypothetical protein
MLWQISWTELHVWQRVNHFPEAKQLTRKDNLKRHIQRFSNIPGKLGDFFDILPVSVRVLHATSRIAEAHRCQHNGTCESRPELTHTFIHVKTVIEVCVYYMCVWCRLRTRCRAIMCNFAPSLPSGTTWTRSATTGS